MIQQISYYISKAGIVSAAGKTEDERRRLSDMPTPAAFVSYAPSLPALVGWYGYRVAFNGVGRVQLEAALDSLRRHFRLRDLREWYDRYSGFYIVEALFAVRMNLPGGVFGGAQPAPVITDYLSLYARNGATITLTRNGSPTVVDLEYSLDNCQTWTDWQEVGNVRTLSISYGKRMYIRNKSATQTGFSTSLNDYYHFEFLGNVSASGNCNSLLCEITNIVTTISDYCFYNLFVNCNSLTLRSGFTLPATTLADSCYRAMFANCSLMTLPEDFILPATTLANYCYNYMFYRCTSLILPESFTLPSTTLANHCYDSMFRNCTSLILSVGFTLPATTLAFACYSDMFNGCASLILPDSFELPATTLISYCYYQMFYGCMSLNKIRTLMTNISAAGCLSNWLSGVAAAGDFYCDQNLTIPTGASGIPSGWTRHDI